MNSNRPLQIQKLHDLLDKELTNINSTRHQPQVNFIQKSPPDPFSQLQQKLVLLQDKLTKIQSEQVQLSKSKSTSKNIKYQLNTSDKKQNTNLKIAENTQNKSILMKNVGSTAIFQNQYIRKKKAEAKHIQLTPHKKANQNHIVSNNKTPQVILNSKRKQLNRSQSTTNRKSLGGNYLLEKSMREIQLQRRLKQQQKRTKLLEEKLGNLEQYKKQYLKIKEIIDKKVKLKKYPGKRKILK